MAARAGKLELEELVRWRSRPAAGRVELGQVVVTAMGRRNEVEGGGRSSSGGRRGRPGDASDGGWEAACAGGRRWFMIFWRSFQKYCQVVT